MEDLCPLCGYSIKLDALSQGIDWELGCNAQPLIEGQCCETCDTERVRLARLTQALGTREQYQKVMETFAKVLIPYRVDGRIWKRRMKHYRKYIADSN